MRYLPSRLITRRKFMKRSAAVSTGLALGGFVYAENVNMSAKSKGRHLHAKLNKTTISRFKNQLSGSLILPENRPYARKRKVWNSMIDRFPLAIVQCADTSDIQRCIAFAQDNDLPVAVRGGGHHSAGFATIDAGLVIDLSAMNTLTVDASSGMATAHPGVVTTHMHSMTQQFGLVVPTGMTATIGMAGMTLGGGEGWLTSKYGLSCDNLMSAELVTAAGERVKTSETENPELLWGLRGGGGNFGIVTSLDYRLHKLKEVTAGVVVFSAKYAADIIRRWRDTMEHAPDELGAMVQFVRAPEPMVVLGVCYAGSGAEAAKVLRPLRHYAPVLQDTVRPMSVIDLQFIFGKGGSEAGIANYWRSHYMYTLSDDAIGTFIEQGNKITSPISTVWLTRYGGALGRVSSTATAYCHRDTPYQVGISTQWPMSDNGDVHINWAKQCWSAMAAYGTGAIYQNWSSEVDDSSSKAAYGVNLPRLQTLKKQYDPDNFFRGNFNVLPV